MNHLTFKSLLARIDPSVRIRRPHCEIEPRCRYALGVLSPLQTRAMRQFNSDVLFAGARQYALYEVERGIVELYLLSPPFPLANASHEG